MRNLNKQIILITGSGSGIGRLMALKFAAEGGRVVLWDLNKAAVEKVATQINESGGEAFPFACDVSDKKAVYNLADKVKDEIGKIDILVNNAGVVSGKPFLECTDEQIIKTMSVNITAHFWTTKAFLPDMIKANHGHLVTISSAAGWLGVSGLADYSASKFAAIGFNESIRMELKKQGSSVKTTCVSTYYINTGLFEGVKTRFSLLLPILDEDLVAHKIIKAVKKNKAYLKMPFMIKLIPVIRFLPTPLFDWIMTFLGVNASMDDFKGRG